MTVDAQNPGQSVESASGPRGRPNAMWFPTPIGRVRVPSYRMIFAAALGLNAATSFAGAMTYFEPGPQLSRTQACVPETAKAGDGIENVNGDRLAIRSLSGKLSSRFSPCAGREQPILAEVEFIESADFHSTLAIDLPADFSRKTLSERERFAIYRVRASDSSHQIYLWVKSWDRRKVADPDAFVDEQRRAQTLLGAITQTPAEHLTIQGVPALRWETQHKPRFPAPNMTYVTTVLIGDSEVAVLTVWGLSRWFAPIRDQLLKIADSVHGLSGAPRESPTAP
jgi:hypothetical protein